jgi:hypothetical protein
MYYQKYVGRNWVRRETTILRTVLVITLAVLGCLWQPLPATQHIVSTADPHRQVCSAQLRRQAGLQQSIGLLRSETSRAVLEVSKLDADQVEKAEAFLSGEEAARLAFPNQGIEQAVAGGAPTSERPIYIVMAPARAVIV